MRVNLISCHVLQAPFLPPTAPAALFLMIQRLAECSITLRKREFYGRYFRPFSVRTVYCDRLDPNTGKTCKGQAAKILYEKNRR